MMCINPMLDLVNINTYIRFDESLSICSQDIVVLKILSGNIKFGQILSIRSQDI